MDWMLMLKLELAGLAVGLGLIVLVAKLSGQW